MPGQPEPSTTSISPAGAGNGVEIDQRLTHGFVDRVLPTLRLDEALIALAAAETVRAGLLPRAVADHDADADAHQRTDVAVDLAVGAQNFHHLPSGADARRHLPHARVLGAGIGVDLFEQLHLGFESRFAERVVVAVELAVGAAGRVRVAAAVAAFDRAHGVRRAGNRRFRQVRGMGIADRLVLHRAQAEALRRVVGCLLEPAVVEGQRLGLAVFEEQFAVVGAIEAAAENAAHLGLVEAGAVDQRGNALIH